MLKALQFDLPGESSSMMDCTTFGARSRKRRAAAITAAEPAKTFPAILVGLGRRTALRFRLFLDEGICETDGFSVRSGAITRAEKRKTF